MATTRTETQAQGPNTDPRVGCFVSSWSLANSENGDAAQFPNADLVTVQVFGTFGGATVTIQGSNANSGSNWDTLRDSVGAALTLTAAGTRRLEGPFTRIRPSVSGGGGSTDLTVVMLFVINSKG